MAKAKSTKRQPKVHSSEKTVVKTVRVKNAKDLVKEFDKNAEKILYKRSGKKLGQQTQKTIVSYGPWLTAILLLIGFPELLVFAKTGEIFGITGFFDTVLFNQQSWVLLVIIFLNAMLLADGLSDVFAKKQRGWVRVYIAHVITTGYIFIHLLRDLSQPAAPIISLAILGLLFFVLYDIRPYYTK